MAKKKLVATKSTGSGYVPGYGTTGPGWAGARSSLAISAQNAVNGTNNQVPGFAGTYTDLTPATPSAPDPYAAARAQYQSLLGNAENVGMTQYRNTIADSFAGEGTTALDLGATLGSRAPGLSDAVATQGAYDWNNVEAGNPFSRAALLMRSYKQQQNRTNNSLAAQGQFNSGAMNNARSEDTFGVQQGQDSLQKALQNYLAGQAANRRGADVNRVNDLNNAGLAGLQSLLGS